MYHYHNNPTYTRFMADAGLTEDVSVHIERDGPFFAVELRFNETTKSMTFSMHDMFDALRSEPPHPQRPCKRITHFDRDGFAIAKELDFKGEMKVPGRPSIKFWIIMAIADAPDAIGVPIIERPPLKHDSAVAAVMPDESHGFKTI